MKDLTRTAIFVFPLTLASQNASATAAGGSRLFFASGNCRSAFAVVSGTKACGARCSVSLQLDFLPKNIRQSRGRHLPRRREIVEILKRQS
jgi:hypothetical protein